MKLDAINHALARTTTVAQPTQADDREAKLTTLQRVEQALGLQFSVEQREAIIHDGKPLAIISCAGSGKTTVIIGKLLFREIYYGIPSHTMLAITFSKKAATELEERYKRAKTKLGLTSKGLPTFKTFHALFYQFVKRVKGEVKVVTEGMYTYELLKEIKHSGVYERKELLQAILDYRSKLINNSLSYDGVMSSKIKDTRIKPERTIFPDEMYFAVINRYNELKNLRREVDFDDMLVYMHHSVVTNPNSFLIEIFQQAYKEVYIDEYQDCSEIIISIMDALIQDQNRLTVIGDDDQSIYGFRGSKSYYILNFKYRYAGAEALYLTDNYRCPTNILNPVITSIEQNKARLPKAIKAYNQGGEMLFFPTTNSYDELLQNIYDEVFNLGGNVNEIAVLVRLNVQKMVYADLLASAEIPVDIGNSRSILQENKVYKTVMGIIYAIKNKDNQLFAEHGRVFLPEINYNVRKRYKDNYMENWYEDVVERDNYLLHKEILANIKHIAQTNNIKDIILHVWLLAKDHYEAQAEAGYGNLEQTVSIFKYMVYVASNQTFDSFKAREMRKAMYLQTYVGLPNTVKVMTLHSVKGLEFDSVYMVGLNGSVFPNRNYHETLTHQGKPQAGEELSEADAYLEEERRLFYVGWTRAKKRLSISYDKKNPTPFLKEVDHPILQQQLQS